MNATDCPRNRGIYHLAMDSAMSGLAGLTSSTRRLGRITRPVRQDYMTMPEGMLGLFGFTVTFCADG